MKGEGEAGCALICGREKKGPDQHIAPDPDLIDSGVPRAYT